MRSCFLRNKARRHEAWAGVVIVVRGLAGGAAAEDCRIEGLDADGNGAESFDLDRHRRPSRLAVTPQAWNSRTWATLGGLQRGGSRTPTDRPPLTGRA